MQLAVNSILHFLVFCVLEKTLTNIDLLNNMDVSHPDLLLEHDIQPIDYRHGLVFRSAIESIRGTFIASSTTGRESLISDVLENMRLKGMIADYKQTGTSRRYDFIVVVERDPDYIAALEVKGGEGNSINISEGPLWAKEFCVWCHLDGAIVNQPGHGAHSIINRLTNELVRRQKSRNEHIWEVHVGLEEIANGRIQRRVMVLHVGDVVDESKSRAWTP